MSTEPFHVDEPMERGGPIAALVIAVPVSLLMWGIAILVVWSIVK